MWVAYGCSLFVVIVNYYCNQKLIYEINENFFSSNINKYYIYNSKFWNRIFLKTIIFNIKQI